MKYLGRFLSLFVLAIALGWSSPENASATFGGYDWSDWLNWFRNYYQEHHHHHKSVPIPGTLLLLAGGMAGVAWSRARRSQD